MKELYKQWCKETKRNGSILVHGSINEFFEWLEEKQIKIFTPEQLNQLLSDVIKDTLNTAAEKALLEYKEYQLNGEYNSQNIGQEICIDNEEPYRNYVSCDKQSILNQFDNVFEKFNQLKQ